jgi:hypothetical protein
MESQRLTPSGVAAGSTNAKRVLRVVNRRTPQSKQENENQLHRLVQEGPPGIPGLLFNATIN